MDYYSAIKRNEIVPSAEMWMNPETVIQSEVKSEREKLVSYNTRYVESRKTVHMDLSAKQK